MGDAHEVSVPVCSHVGIQKPKRKIQKSGEFYIGIRVILTPARLAKLICVSNQDINAPCDEYGVSP
jgi:hypothetical protein